MYYYWMKPNGDLIEVPKFGHEKYAIEYLKSVENVDIKYSFASSYLHDNGWVRVCINYDYEPIVEIYGNCIDLTKPMRNTMDPAMTSNQMKVAKKLCKEYNCSLHKAINDKRFW